MIPRIFSLYNIDKQNHLTTFSPQKIFYNNLVQVYGRASDCIGCGQCVRACPQHLNIIELLKECSAHFD